MILKTTSGSSGRTSGVPCDGILHTVCQRVAQVQLSRHIGGRDHHREYTLLKKLVVFALKYAEFRIRCILSEIALLDPTPDTKL
jgi:hypothetical protein